MSTMPEHDSADSNASPPARRSRWQRFSPSMGWSAFWSEILIVVLGVAIALASSEAVDAWNWRNKVRDAEVRLKSDTDMVFMWSAELLSVRPCVIAQLDAHARRIMEGGETLVPAPVFSEQTNIPFAITYVFRAPRRPWRFGVWEALLADGTAPHFDQARQRYYNGIQSQVAAQREYRNESDRLRGRMNVLAYPVALTSEVRQEFLVDLESLRHQTLSATIVATQLMQVIDADRGGLSTQEAKAVDASVKDSGTAQFCKAQGLPLANWRDFRQEEANNATPSPVKAP